MIREATLDDAANITNIYNHYITKTTVTFETEPLTPEQMRQRIIDISSHFPYIVYESEGQVAGYAYVHPWKERAAFARTLETTVYLAPQAKHEGIGSKLMQHIIGLCRLQGFRVLVACITAENKESIEFHKRMGFTQASLFHNVGYKFDRWLDVVDMEMQL